MGSGSWRVEWIPLAPLDRGVATDWEDEGGAEEKTPPGQSGEWGATLAPMKACHSLVWMFKNVVPCFLPLPQKSSSGSLGAQSGHLLPTLGREELGSWEKPGWALG